MKGNAAFFSSLGLLLLLNSLLKPLWIFGIDRPVQNLAGTAAYGPYFSLLGLTLTAGFLLDGGLTAYTSRQLALSKDPSLVRQLLRVKSGLALLYILVVSAIGWVTGIEELSWLLLLIVIQVLHSFFLFFRALLTAHQWFSTDAWLSVLDKALMLLIAGTFLWTSASPDRLTITRFLWVQAVCTATALLVTIWLVRKKGIQTGRSVAAGQGAIPLLKKAFPFALLVALMAAHYRLDGFLLERIHPQGAYEAGLYAGAYRLLDAANMAGYLVASFLLPLLAAQLQQQERFKNAVRQSRHLLMLLTGWLTITVVMMPGQIQELLYHQTDARAETVLTVCLLALPGYSLTQIYGTVLTARGEIGVFCRLTAVVLIINLLLNSWLIPRYGALGCCWAAVVSHTLGGCWAAWKSGESLADRTWLFYTAIGAAVVLYYFVTLHRGMSTFVLSLGGAGLTALLAWITGLLPVGKGARFFLSTDK